MAQIGNEIGELIESDETYRSINWSDMPPKTGLNVRMSGLKAYQSANSAYLTLKEW